MVGAVTRPPARAGRRGVAEETPVARVARSAGLPVLETSKPSSPDSLATLREWAPDLGIVVAYGAILPTQLLELPRAGWINLHFSDLPRWRGAAPVQWTIRAGDETAATSVFQLEEGLDTGPVFSTLSVPVAGAETAGELLHRLSLLGADQVLEVVNDIERGREAAKPQSAIGITLAPRLVKADAFVDFEKDSQQIDRLVRSVTPNPGAWTTLPNGSVLKLGPVTNVGGSNADLAGTITATKNDVFVACAAGAVRLGKVAPAGKKWMEAGAWLRGARWNPSWRLGGTDEQEV